MTDEPVEEDVVVASEVTIDEPSSGRSWVPTTLIVIATLIAIVSTFTTWVRTQVLDTDEWVSASNELLADPQVQEALSTYLANELFERVDMKTEFADLLPAEFSGLAGALAGALREPVTNGIDRLVASDRFAQLWEDANRLAHARMVAILRDETVPSVSTADGTVTLDLSTLVRNVGETLGLPDAALDRIPADAGQVVIFESDELADVQKAVQIADFLSWFLFIVVVVMYAIAVFLARGRRITTLRNVGLALVAGGVAVLIIRALGIRVAVSEFIERPANEPLGKIVAGIATDLIRQSGWTGIVYGVLIAVFAALLGGHRWAVATRRYVGRATESKGVAVAAGLIFVLLMLVWSPGRSFDRWVTAIVFIALSIGAVVAFLTMSAREHQAVEARE